jgi:hypothetical protein
MDKYHFSNVYRMATTVRLNRHAAKQYMSFPLHNFRKFYNLFQKNYS